MMLSARRLLFCVFLLLLASSCGLEERKNKARANSVRGFISGTVGYFNSEASVICAEVAEAKTEVVPPLDKVCSKGCSCASSAPGDADPKTVYDCDLWRAREWKMLRFMGRYTLDEKIKPVVYFHHQARWRRTEQGCRLDFTVYGDLDSDGVYSTYTVMSETTPSGALGEWPDESLLWE